LEDPQDPPKAQHGQRAEYVVLDEIWQLACGLPPLTLAQRLELDARIHGTCFVKLTEQGPVRVDPREVLGE
jgi:hypothetical protein